MAEDATPWDKMIAQYDPRVTNYDNAILSNIWNSTQTIFKTLLTISPNAIPMIANLAIQVVQNFNILNTILLQINNEYEEEARIWRAEKWFWNRKEWTDYKYAWAKIKYKDDLYRRRIQTYTKLISIIDPFYNIAKTLAYEGQRGDMTKEWTRFIIPNLLNKLKQLSYLTVFFFF